MKSQGNNFGFWPGGLMSTPRRKLFICLAVLRCQIPDQLSWQIPMTYEAAIFGTKKKHDFWGLNHEPQPQFDTFGSSTVGIVSTL